MPTSAGLEYIWTSDPLRWQRCMQQAGDQMERDGWNRKARKFYDVRLKKAKKLWDSQR